MTIKENAVQLWTKLIVAMRADGLIAECVTQSGPATTALLVELVQEPGYEGAWMSMNIVPSEPHRQVVAVALDKGTEVALTILTHDGVDWRYANGSLCDTRVWYRWTYVKLPENKG
jgi:hypothetical protein